MMPHARDCCYAIMVSGKKEMQVLNVDETTIVPNHDMSSGR
jgi:hypothetical protein